MSIPVHPDVYKELKADQILHRVTLYWDWSKDGLPRPYSLGFDHELIKCLCGNSDWHVRSWEFFQHRDENHRVMHRCNVAMKCTWCSFTGVWGLAIPQDLFDRWVDYPRQRSVAINWRAV